MTRTPPSPHARQRGFNLIEVTVFIVVLALGVTGVFIAFGNVARANLAGNIQTEATQLAQERMELILTQKREKGFGAFTDPCVPGPGPAQCTPPSGYYVVPTPTLNGAWNGQPTTDYRIIEVRVLDAQGNVLARLQTLVANY